MLINVFLKRMLLLQAVRKTFLKHLGANGGSFVRALTGVDEGQMVDVEPIQTLLSRPNDVHQQTAPDPVVCLFLLTKLPQLHIERRRAGLNQVMVQQENFMSYSWGYQVSHD